MLPATTVLGAPRRTTPHRRLPTATVRIRHPPGVSRTARNGDRASTTTSGRAPTPSHGTSRQPTTRAASGTIGPEQAGGGYASAATEARPYAAADGETQTDEDHIAGFSFDQEPRPPRRKPLIIGIIACVLAVGVSASFLVRRHNGADKAVPAPATSNSPTSEATVTSTATPSASASAVGGVRSAQPAATVPSDARDKPSPELVKHVFGAPDAQVRWVAMAADGQNAAAHAPSFTIDGKSPDAATGGHLAMRKVGTQRQRLPNGGVITNDADCDAMLRTLGPKAAVAVSQVMRNNMCDAAIVYDMARSAPIRLGNLAGLGPVNLNKATPELAETIHVIPDGVGAAAPEVRRPTHATAVP